MSTDVVPAWNLGEIQSFHPQLTLSSTAPVAEVLTLLEAGLRDASFKVKKRSAEGFEARYTDWVDLIAGGINRTTLTIAAAPDGAGTTVIVSGREHQSGKGGAKKVAHGLSTAVEALRVRGYEAGTTPWRAAEKG